MAKNWGRNMSEQYLTNNNIVQQVGIKYYLFGSICVVFNLFAWRSVTDVLLLQA